MSTNTLIQNPRLPNSASWINWGLCVLFLMSCVFSMVSFAVLTPNIENETGLSSTSLSSITSVFFFTFAIAQEKLAHIFGANMPSVRVYKDHVGGGFGGKQEVLSEDLAILAAMKTGRPCKFDFTRQEEFIGASFRHPMKIRVKTGHKLDGTMTAIQMRVVSDTGAYGNHGGETLYSACHEPVSLYRCANKDIEGYSVYTNNVPSGGFRGYGASQTAHAIETHLHEVATELEIDPLELRRLNVIRPGDNLTGFSEDHGTHEIGSYGLGECIDRLEEIMSTDGGLPDPPEEDGWLCGNG